MDNLNDDGVPVKRPRLISIAELLGVDSAPVASQAGYDASQGAFVKTSSTWASVDNVMKSMPRLGIPLTVLTGFLGAGKTTVLNYILNAPHGLRIAVLINEFGSVDIDNQLVDTMVKDEQKPESEKKDHDEPDLVKLDNGCICCTISTNFVDAILKILDDCESEKNYPDYILVETTGLADPEPILNSVKATELSEMVYVDQVLTVVDASSWDADVHYESDTAIQQIVFADTLLLSKTDLVSPQRVNEVARDLLEMKESARILRSAKGAVPVEALFDIRLDRERRIEELIELKAQKLAEKKKNEENAHNENDKRGEHTHDHGEHKHEHGEHKHGDEKKEQKTTSHFEREGFNSVAIEAMKPFDMEKFRLKFIENVPRGVYRAKGILWFDGMPERYIFHLSGVSRMTVDMDDWPENESPKTQFVVIGRKLDQNAIRKIISECFVDEARPLPQPAVMF